MSSTAFALKDIFIYRKTSIFEWSIFMQQKYFSSLVLNTDRNCTHCQQLLKISEFYLATIYNLLLKVEVLTWPLCSTRQQPQGSRRSGFRHYPFIRRKHKRGISREIASPSLTLARGSPPSLACTCCPGLSPRREQLVEHNFWGRTESFRMPTWANERC